ncbi:MAG: triose-phosphate isomerase [Desulfovibrio sp.]|jgi:triosephosphate isomerase|nr:triose-phosphate isomerase [Desulfovibrio sp.]
MKMLMAANWKMFKTRREAADCARGIENRLAGLPADRETVLFAPFTSLAACAEALGPGARLRLGGQNCYPAAEGAFTGEISPGMLLDCACSHVLVGHSERRALLGESDAFIGKKCAYALNAGLAVTLCIGETLQERDGGMLRPVLERQLAEGLSGVPDDIAAERLCIAYEPVWAIGTGRVAGPAEILEAHALIRAFLRKRFASEGSAIRILYGGSVKADNAEEIISLDNVDGVLVGGASLQAETFALIALAGLRA